MNGIFLAIVSVAFAVGAFRQIASGNTHTDTMDVLARGIVADAGSAVTLAIGLVGVMTLFLGLMKVGEAGGLLGIVARLLRPLMLRLFPSVPPEHPAMGAMILNIAANVLGLGNAATPFGIRAMQHLDSINPAKGTATNAMVLFLAINTSSVTLLPTGVIALRAAAGSSDPAGILPTTLFATTCSSLVAIGLAKACERIWPNPEPIATEPGTSAADAPSASLPDSPASEGAISPDVTRLAERGYPLWVSLIALSCIALLIPLTVAYGTTAAPWIIPGLVFGLLAFGAARGVRVYEAFVDGARDGFQVAIRIIPYLVAIVVAVGMFRASGALDLLIHPLGAVTTPLGLPAEALIMGLLRPLSGSGAFAYLASLLNDPQVGPDSFTGYLVSTIQGSTETTFYVLAVYFGAVGIRRMRYAILVGLAADAVGVGASVFICDLLHGG
ncbi:MAG: spore maturation protein [Rhodospirillales bacterium]|nr:spore maturation protein [Rhodospirillales bacterium]